MCIFKKKHVSCCIRNHFFPVPKTRITNLPLPRSGERDSNMTHQETKVCWGSKPDSEIALEVEIPPLTHQKRLIYRFPKEGGCRGKGVTGTLGFVGEP